MKRRNKKLTTFLLAGVCTLSLGVAAASVRAAADDTATAKSYSVTNIFSASTGGTIESKTVGEKETVAFTLANGGYVRYTKDLAFKWYKAKNDAGYLNLKFAFEALNFTSVTFTFESAASVVNEDKKAVNAVEFTHDGTTVSATIINGETKGNAVVLTGVGAGSEIALKLGSSENFDEFSVTANDIAIGNFTQIGANFADYSYNEIEPLKISAKTEGDAKATVLFKQLNGQAFDDVKKEGGKDMVEDNAAPVLVVNEEISSFQYGTQFSLVPEKIDVLQSSVTEDTKYYQWNPADTAKDEDAHYKTMPSTKPFLMDSVYYTKADGSGYSSEKTTEYTKATSVYQVYGEEYISVKYTLSDPSNNSQGFDLSWYAKEVQAKTLKNESNADESADYIKVMKKTEGPSYRHITLSTDPAVKENVRAVDYETAMDAYQARVTDAAKDVVEGSSNKVSIPDVEKLIEDKTGSYRALKFTISYIKPDGSKSTSSSLSYNALSISTPTWGEYEFKIFAVDRTGNGMKYYLDEELVTVNTANVWDIEEIPSFTFEIEDSKIAVEDKESNRRAEKILDQTYSLSGLTVVGTTSSKSKYALYRFDGASYNGTAIAQSKFSAIKYETIREKAVALLDKVGEDKTYASYFDLYLSIYAEELAKSVNANATAADISALKACFKAISAYDSETEQDDNAYEWNESAKSFTTATEGEFLLLMDVCEVDNPMQRAVGYKLVIVESEADSVKGESEVGAWIKKNLVSVILFGVAALLLIAILVLLFIKPSDETLDDVELIEARRKERAEAKAAKKAEKAAKKAADAEAKTVQAEETAQPVEEERPAEETVEETVETVETNED